MSGQQARSALDTGLAVALRADPGSWAAAPPSRKTVFATYKAIIDTSAPRVSVQSVHSSATEAAKTASSLLLLDGRLRVFRVLPSGLSSMIATAGGWSIGDYAGVLSDDAQSLSLDFFAFAEGFHPQSGGEITVVRRLSLTLTPGQERGEAGSSSTRDGVDERETIMLVHGVIYGSAMRSDVGALTPDAANPISTRGLSTASSADRSAVWSDLRWTPLVEMQADYVAVPLTRG